ncbi:MAG: hypothetical protein ACI9O6_000913 [Glaciecola sp.]|jgi:hypothetical protein
MLNIKTRDEMYLLISVIALTVELFEGNKNGGIFAFRLILKHWEIRN